MNGMTVKSCFQFVLIQVWLKCYVLSLNYSCVILFLELLYTVHCLLLHVAHMFPVMQSVLILFYRELLRCLYYLLCTSKKNVFYLLNIYYLFQRTWQMNESTFIKFCCRNNVNKILFLLLVFVTLRSFQSVWSSVKKLLILIYTAIVHLLIKYSHLTFFIIFIYYQIWLIIVNY